MYKLSATCLLAGLVVLLAASRQRQLVLAAAPQAQLDQGDVDGRGGGAQLGPAGRLQQQQRQHLEHSAENLSGGHSSHDGHDHGHGRPADAGTKVSMSPLARQQPSGALPFEGQLLHWLRDIFAKGPANEHVTNMFDVQESYDFSAHLSTLQLLERANFRYETFNSTSEDGYVTQLVRIINPYVVRARPIPVVFYGGQGVSPGVFLAASVDKNHARDETKSDWSYEATNSSRSLALTLANNGYDVWLLAARGCDSANRARLRPKELAGGKQLQHQKSDFFAGIQEQLRKLTVGAHDYWSFSADEIAKLELRRQLELVMSTSGRQRLSLVSYSNGALISFAFMAREPEFAHVHIDAHVSIGPAVFVNKYNLALSAAGLASHLSPASWPFPEDHLSQLTQGGFFKLCKSKLIRYTACKALLDSLYGHSDIFQTQLELALFEYIGRPTSPRGVAQIVQTAFSGRLRCYDYGPIGNLFAYGQLAPTAYNLSSIGATRTEILLVSGKKDAIADEYSVKRLSRQLCAASEHELGPQSAERVSNVVIPGYNHLDLLAAWNVGEQVNRRVLQYLNDRDVERSYDQDQLVEGPRDGDGDGDETSDEQADDLDADSEAQYEPEQGPLVALNNTARFVEQSKPVQPPPSLVATPKEMSQAKQVRPSPDLKQQARASKQAKPISGQRSIGNNINTTKRTPIDRTA